MFTCLCPRCLSRADTRHAKLADVGLISDVIVADKLLILVPLGCIRFYNCSFIYREFTLRTLNFRPISPPPLGPGEKSFLTGIVLSAFFDLWNTSEEVGKKHSFLMKNQVISEEKLCQHFDLFSVCVWGGGGKSGLTCLQGEVDINLNHRGHFALDCMI